MIKALHLRLTVIFTAFTSLVLILAMITTFIISINQNEAQRVKALNDLLSTIHSRIVDSKSISDDWLSLLESDNHCTILITDNGAPLHFNGTLATDTDRDILSQRAIGNSGNIIKGDGDEEYAVLSEHLLLPKAVDITILQHISFYKNKNYRLAMQYLCLFIVCTAVLCGICYMLARIAFEPTRKNIIKQNEFIAAASHELRAPLTVIRASLAAVPKKAIPLQAVQLIQSADSEAARMGRLVEDMLSLASSDVGAYSVNKKQIEPDNLIIEMYEQYRLPSLDKAHKLTLALPSCALPALYQDKERIMQILGIFIMNAIEYTPCNSSIELSVFAKKSAVVFSVKDHGAGIQNDSKDKIFDRFYRGDTAHTDKTHTGLGLCVAKALALALNAEISVKDTDGGGATFELSVNN